MNPHFQRARLLLEQRRYADAERELRQALAADPNLAEGHAMLAEALLDQQRLDEASEEAQVAITQDPELEVAYFVMARIMAERNRYEDAQAAIHRAIEIAPYSRSFAMLSAIRFEQRDWLGALAAADEGLAVDPENGACLNLRAMALRQLGRHDEADHTLAGALENDPDDSFAHANRGWSELHRSRPNEALVHLKEALRLDPTNDHARAGLVEAMKARYFLYRIVLNYFLWMSRLGQSAQFAIIIGGWIGYRVLRGVTQNNPQLSWITLPLTIAYLGFVWMTWLAAPLMNLALRMHPIGKFALSKDQLRTANLVGGLLLIAIIIGVIALVLNQEPSLRLALGLVVATLPASLIFIADRGWPRAVLTLMTVGWIAFVVAIMLSEVGAIAAFVGEKLDPLTVPFLLICLLGGQYVAAQRVKH